MRIEKTALDAQNRCVYSLYKEKGCIGHAVTCADCFEALEIAPEWQSRGYGSYLLREVLRQNGGFDRTAPSEFTAPLPDAGNTAAQALAAKFGFVPRGGLLVRRRVPDLTAVELTHRFLRSTLAPGGLYLDATCGNGHDTLFLCSVAGENGRVIGLDIQPQAAANTNALLAANGMAAIGRAECCDHRKLLRFAPPGSADCVMFNFGWLPGAAHDVHSTADSTLPALQAGLDALKPGGVLAAVLYSGKVIGNAEKKAAAEFFRSLPLADYTVLICEFANEMGVQIRITSGPAIEKPGDLAALLTNLQEGDVLFIDEIHRLSRQVEEVLYPALEDYALDIMIGKGPSAQSIRINLPRFTLVGATTRAGQITGPLRDRFGVLLKLELYSPDELSKIIQRSAGILDQPITPEGAYELAKRSRGTPRVANRFLKRIRDFATVLGDGIIDRDVALMGLKRMDVDALGLDELDRSMLRAIIEMYNGGPVGLETLAAALGEESVTLEDLCEPYLMQMGFLTRTPRGRCATRLAYEHLGLKAPEAAAPEDNGQQSLF